MREGWGGSCVGRLRALSWVIPVVLVAAACSGGGDARDAVAGPPPAAVSRPPAALVADYPYPPAPTAPSGPLAQAVEAAAQRLAASGIGGGFADPALDRAALEVVANSGDARLAWLIADRMRFSFSGADQKALVAAFTRLTGVDAGVDPVFARSPWQSVTNHLIAWNLPAEPGYREHKAAVFLQVEPKWKPFFADADSAIDWRLLSWGGVLIDDRAAGAKAPCPNGCIPALDDPAGTEAARGDWYPDERIVFGVQVGAQALALPKNIMEVHEMVNLTLDGARLAIPYCTLCGSAQAYRTDGVAGASGPLVLRTSGLLSRSNKVMYELGTRSVFDTFTGRALSGPLHAAGVQLAQVSVVTSTWGAWKKAHPGTRILAQDGGIGRSYADDPLGGRDDNGPIFPVGPVDPRLPVQALVIGVLAPDGTPTAFPVDAARAALARGQAVNAGEVELYLDGDGLRARRNGTELPAHQAFWFAWSQFNPATAVWDPGPR